MKSERLFCIADAAVERGEMGADRWYQYHKKTVTRLRELVAILENPDIENVPRLSSGAMISASFAVLSQRRLLRPSSKKAKKVKKL
ncbi:hypothetical protein QDU34_24865 (plasmid) [Escherichia coli]|nr:hypothetical protein [Escherichia coli]WGI94126.1 hypothetical protein QDU34_24865 [Escherichia coli]